MKILTIHSDFISFEPKKKAIKGAEEYPSGETRVEECLAVFCAVEKADEGKKKRVVENTVVEIEKVLEQVKTDRVVVYPWVHLTSSPSKPVFALEVLKDLEKALAVKHEVTRAPFGWYKSFTVSCKGHPLSELSREISAEEDKKKEGEVKGEKFHRFVLVDSGGKEYEVTRDNWDKCELLNKKDPICGLLRIFVRNEVSENPSKGKPKHIEYMRKLELLDYCPESDVGHMKWYPDGMLIFDLIHDYAFFNIALPWGAFKMKNPLIYRDNVAEIGKLMGEFHERDYFVHGGEKDRFVLRFASDPGGFPFVQKVGFSYKQMPLKVYEEAICFRREQKGEVVGLRRMRNFHMTDMHAFCMSSENAKKEFVSLCSLFGELMDKVIAPGRWVLGWEGTEDFFEENKEWLVGISKQLGVPAFFKLMREMTHYYVIKNEFQVIGADEANVQVSTVQWDVKDGERFDICYVNEEGKRIPVPVILHASSFGSIERTLYGVLENAARDESEGKPPMLPLWLCPIQVRICPVSDQFSDHCASLCEKINSMGVRCDLDDRRESVGYKIRDAESRWIPFVVVVGEKEKKSGKLSVRDRKSSKVSEMALDELVEKIRELTREMPFRPSYLPRRVSMRPIFVG